MTPEQRREADRQYNLDCEAAEVVRGQRIMQARLTFQEAQMAWHAAQAGLQDSIRRADALRDYAIDQAGERFNETLDRFR